MKIKLDENLPRRLVGDLTKLGHDVEHVTDEHLSGMADGDLWPIVQAEERFFVTQDLDFSDERRYRPGLHQGLLLLRLGNPTARELRSRVREIFMNEDTQTWQGALVVANKERLRVRRP